MRATCGDQLQGQLRHLVAKVKVILLVVDRPHLAHVEASLGGALVAAILQADVTLARLQLLLSELPLVLSRHFGAIGWALIPWLVGGLQ